MEMIINNAIKKAPFDKMRNGTIVQVYADNTYDVRVDGVVMPRIRTIGADPLLVNDVIKVVIPENQISNMIILGRGGSNLPPLVVPVTSVNGKTGAVVLAIEDIPLLVEALGGKYSDTNPPPYPVLSVNGLRGEVVLAIPTKTSDLINDSGFQTSTDVNTAIETHNTAVNSHADIRGLIVAEKDERVAGDLVLSGDITANTDKINTEITDRTNADIGLQNSITLNTDKINTEIIDRTNADIALRNSITLNTDKINAEIIDRTNADIGLQNSITINTNDITFLKNTKMDKVDLATVASTGNYNDLTNRPIVNGGLSQITTALTNTGYETKQLRNITISTRSPVAADGSNGDVWLVYGG